jgi:hypothetical protein
MGFWIVFNKKCETTHALNCDTGIIRVKNC